MIKSFQVAYGNPEDIMIVLPLLLEQYGFP